MAAELPSPKGTPKRKRDDVLVEQRLSSAGAFSPSRSSRPTFAFQPPKLSPVKYGNDLVEDGNSSPRTKVAQKLGALALREKSGLGEGGGGVIVSSHAPEGTSSTGSSSSSNYENSHQHQHQLGHSFANPRFSPSLPIFDLDGVTASTGGGEMQLDDDEDDGATRKRIKFPEPNSATPDIDPIHHPHGESSANAADPLPVQTDVSGPLNLQTVVDPAIVKMSKSTAVGRLQKSYPSINRLSDSKSRSRRRAGTPPVSRRKPTSESTIDEDAAIVDPVRAALTWHEDEITIYDPMDEDDDGTGINGIGFKPTPAIAYARAQKRRQQLAEYKKREESEARAKRNQRRREQPGGGGELERKHSMVRVHFSETEPTTVVMT
ncbi:hypothetical protein F4809DRAFT_651798 [Biscogniauxia mediterranea]|nr:hypothetical protein F4809DRAFT_651798 [Biscogniauxia mediterranea]